MFEAYITVRFCSIAPRVLFVFVSIPEKFFVSICLPHLLFGYLEMVNSQAVDSSDGR